MGYTDDLHSLSHTKWNCKYRNKSFLCREYYVDTVRKNSRGIKEYKRNKLKKLYSGTI